MMIICDNYNDYLFQFWPFLSEIAFWNLDSQSFINDVILAKAGNHLGFWNWILNRVENDSRKKEHCSLENGFSIELRMTTKKRNAVLLKLDPQSSWEWQRKKRLLFPLHFDVIPAKAGIHFLFLHHWVFCVRYWILIMLFLLKFLKGQQEEFFMNQS